MLVVQCLFLPFRRLLLFSLTSYPAEIAFFSSSNRELSNSERLVLHYRNINVHPSSSPYYSDHIRLSHIVNFCPFEGFYFSVLRPILLKLHISAHLIKSFATVYSWGSCIEIKMSIRPAAHTTMIIYARSALSIFALSNAFIFQSCVLTC